MKSFVVQILVGGTYSKKRREYNATTGQTIELAPRLLTDSDYFRFTTIDIPDLKNLIEPIIIGEIKRANYFYVDKSLWKWTTERKTFQFELWLTLTFTDNEEIGKTAFMKKVYSIWIFQYTHRILKAYS